METTTFHGALVVGQRVTYTKQGADWGPTTGGGIYLGVALDEEDGVPYHYFADGDINGLPQRSHGFPAEKGTELTTSLTPTALIRLHELREDAVIVHAKTLVVGDVVRPINYWGDARYRVVEHDVAAKRIVTEPLGEALHDLEWTYGGGYHNVVKVTPRGLNEQAASDDEAVLLHDGETHAIRENDEGDVLCPKCGHDDVAMWADDGEADAADWWGCEKFSGGCGATGAVVDKSNTTRTLNGVKVPS